mmetsp:Transcript_27503/g.35177  ORF Transcript_27503/g.35177 Transcript_27503/m.35177 type:complete len:161 (+) Transcript_27503:94-576(+)|eukprot:12648389-Ditylum_brightwellii.AAC.1
MTSEEDKTTNFVLATRIMPIFHWILSGIRNNIYGTVQHSNFDESSLSASADPYEQPTPDELQKGLKPASHYFIQAQEEEATEDIFVKYGGSTVHIHKGDTYYVDNRGHVLIGKKGTYDPPHGMVGEDIYDLEHRRKLDEDHGADRTKRESWWDQFSLFVE